MGKLLRILMIEDADDDADLILQILKKGGFNPKSARAETAKTISTALRNKPWDIILCDNRLKNSFSYVNVLTLLAKLNLDIPVIALFDTIGEEEAIACIKSGVQDYVTKNNLFRLIPAIERELLQAKSRAERKRTDTALRESEARFRTLADSGMALIWTSGINKECDYFNQPWLNFTGRSLEQELGNGWIGGVHPDDLDRCLETYSDSFDRCQKFSIAYRLRRHDGEYRWIQDDGSPRYNSKGEFIGYIGHCLDITGRKRTEEKLRESNERYQAILKSIEDVYYEVDLAGNFTFFNDSACRILGYSREELTGMNFRQYMDEDNARKALATFSNVLTTGKVARIVDWKIITKSRNECFLEVSVSLRRDKEGKPIGFQGIARDVTERKQVEETIRHISAIQNHILENSTLGIAFVRNCIFEWANVRLGELLMLPLHQVQEFLSRVIYPFDEGFGEMENTACPIPTCAERSEFVRRIKRSDGTLFWCRFIGKALNPAQPQDGSIWMLEDITERKQAEEALRKSEEKYRNIFENASEGIFQSTPDGRYVSLNPAFARIGGFSSPQEMIDTVKFIGALYVHPEERIKIMELLGCRGFVNNYEVEILRSDGVIIWISANVRAVRDARGKLVLLEGTITDVTERKKAQMELQKKNLELAETYEELKKEQAMIIQQEKMASIGMLSAGIAHEIKNPLAIILQGMDYLQLTIKDDALTAEVINRINAAVFRADIIVKGLLNYARQHAVALTEEDMTKIIDESMALTEHEFRAKNIRLVKNYELDLPRVSVDGNQMKQVFVNLILNSIAAMPPRGILTVSVRHIKDPFGKNALQISFKDTGHGIKADDLKRIFDPFFTTKPIGNTGLGLSISKGIIDNHKGIIFAESRIGKGTNFIINLPIL